MPMLLKERVRRGHGRGSVACSGAVTGGAATRSHARRLPGREGARPPEVGAHPPGPSVLASRASTGPQGAATRAAWTHLRSAVRAAVKVAGSGHAKVSRVVGERAPDAEPTVPTGAGPGAPAAGTRGQGAGIGAEPWRKA